MRQPPIIRPKNPWKIKTAKMACHSDQVWDPPKKDHNLHKYQPKKQNPEREVGSAPPTSINDAYKLPVRSQMMGIIRWEKLPRLAVGFFLKTKYSGKWVEYYSQRCLFPTNGTSFNLTKEKDRIWKQRWGKRICHDGEGSAHLPPLKFLLPWLLPPLFSGFYWSPRSNEMEKRRILSMVTPNKKWAFSRINNDKNKNKNEFFIC